MFVSEQQLSINLNKTVSQNHFTLKTGISVTLGTYEGS